MVCVFETLKYDPSDILSPARAYLLSIPKQYDQLVNKFSNIGAYGDSPINTTTLYLHMYRIRNTYYCNILPLCVCVFSIRINIFVDPFPITEIKHQDQK